HLGAALTARSAATTPLHVVDLAKNGATTESHRAEGLWAAVLDATAPGDLVLLQFGHNDQKHEHLSARGERCSCLDRKSTRLNSSHVSISYAVFCLKQRTRREDY